MGSMEGGGAPILNDYKLEFFWKRFPQTLLGGLRLKLGYDAPVYVYVNQVVVFLIPFLLGGLFTIFVEFSIISDVNSCYIYGSLMAAFVLSTQLVSWLIRRRSVGLAKLQRNLLAQDDEVDFVSCCGLETVDFICPPKKFIANVFIHSVISGVLCGLMFLYLLPSTLNVLYSNTGATVVLFALGWWTACTAQYSLTSVPPPELSIFRALDTWEITPLMRPFYALVFGIIGVLARHYSELVSVDKALHILFPFLPLLWIMGILPPLDALLPWLAEQALVLVLGGSPLATDLRLLVMFILSSIVVVMATFIPSSTVDVVVLTACFGYILSIDIFGLLLQAWNKLNNKDSTCLAGQRNWKEIIIYLVMLLLTAATSAVANHFSSDTSSDLLDAFCYIFVALVVIVKVLGDAQGVSFFFGLFRNPLYPSSIEAASAFKKRKKVLRVVGLVRQVLLVYVSPLLLVAFLSMFLAPDKVNIPAFAAAIGTVRALRQVWQNTPNSLLEVAVVCLTVQAVGAEAAAWWATAGLGLQLMLVGACRDRLQQLFNKLVFMATLTVTSWKLPKQRHRSTVPILISSAVLLPVVLALLGTATVVAAPLLPLFCLPLFLVGFPRTLRSWPKAASTAAAACADSVYYKQLTPQIASGLSVTMAMGTLGNPTVGDHYLVRFQDRLIWVHVLEVGYKFCSVVIKGLELQETSCHTVEATRVDDVFQDILMHEGKWPLISLNQHPGNVLRPADALVLNTYSDAKNVLTGVIDQPENLRKNSENFLKTLIWVFVQYCKDRKFESKENDKKPVLINLAEQNTVNVKATEVVIPVGSIPAAHEIEPMMPVNKPTKNAVVRLLSQDDIELEHLPRATKQLPQTVVAPKRRRSGSLPSLSDSVWSQESLKLDESFTSPGKRKQSFGSGVLAADEGIEDLNDSFNLGGFPALDVGKPAASKNPGGKVSNRRDPTLSELEDDVLYYGAASFKTAPAVNDAIKSAAFTSEHAHRLDLPPRWKSTIPVDRHHTDALLARFPDFWFKHVVKCLDFGVDSQSTAQNIVSDSVLIGLYRHLTCACYAIVEVLGFPGSSAVDAGPSHVYKVYSGDFPWSLYVDWLDKDAELKLLVLKAYRYAFKLTYDEAVLGEVTSEDELVEYMTEYDKDWYLGSETDPDWQLAVMNNKPSLFSLGRDKGKGTYTSRVLTKQEIMAPLGRLNGECVRGQWASLALELLYFTNDDEERYSIQAHPTLLRNLTIQAADPPLGYPVFSSGAVSVPLAVPPL